MCVFVEGGGMRGMSARETACCLFWNNRKFVDWDPYWYTRNKEVVRKDFNPIT